MTQKDCFNDPAETMVTPTQKRPELKTKHPKAIPDVPTTTEIKNKSSKMTLQYKVAHQLLSHPGQNTMKNTAKYYDWLLQGKPVQCEPCSSAKGHQKNISKTPKPHAENPGERLYVDLSTLNKTSLGGNHHWGLITDDHSRLKWSLFMKKKSDFPTLVINAIKQLQVHEYLPKEVILHLDNSGKNSIIPSLALEQNLNLKFEFTVPHTPQQNGVVEKGFPTISGRARVMMNDDNFSDECEGIL